MEKSILGNFFCREIMMFVCNPACFVCTFTYDKQMVWLKRLVTHETSRVIIHNVSILPASISSFSSEPHHSSKTVIRHKYTLRFRLHYTNLLVISFSQCNSNAWKLHTPVTHSCTHCCQAVFKYIYIYIYPARTSILKLLTPDSNMWYKHACYQPLEFGSDL